MTTAQNILSRLDKVRERGRGRWSARCPAHEDRGPSLSIKETAEGAVLVYCFAGCSIESVLGAVGLDFDALFPPKPSKPGAGSRPSRLGLPAAQALEVLVTESTLIALIGGDMVRKKTITDVDHQRLIKAVGRVHQIAEATR